MASIVKRGDHQYQVTIRRKGFKPQYETFETEREAEDWATVIESEMVRKVFVDRNELERTTLGDLLALYREEVQEHAGARQELSRIKRWQEHPLALRSLASLRTVDFTRYRNQRLKEVGRNTVRLELALVSAMFNVARVEWSMEGLKNPLDGILIGTSPGRDRRLLGDEEERLLVAAGKARSHPNELKAAILLAIETGLREGRLAHLSWEQVDLHKGVVWVKTKAKKGEQQIVPVPLTEKAVDILRSLPCGIAKGRVFGHAFPTTQALGSAFRRACDRAKIYGLTFHDLRHEAATRFARKMNVQTLAKVMTWTTLQMAMRYFNPSEDDLVAAVRAA